MKTAKVLLLLVSCLSLTHAQDVFLSLSRTSGRLALPTSVETVSQKDFERWNAQTAGEAISRLTSIQVQPLGGLGGVQTIRLRGSNTNQNLVLIDGRPIGSVAFASSQDLTEIPVEAIERIEVVRGGISSVYGPNALAGVVSIITKRGATEKPSGSVGYEYGSYGRNIFRADVGAKKGPLDYFLYGNKQHEGGFRDNSDASTFNVGANLGMALGHAGKFQVDGSVYKAEQGVPGQFSPAIATNRFDNRRERAAVNARAEQQTETKALRLGHEIQLPMESKIATRLWGSEREVRYKDLANFVNSDRNESTKGAEIQANVPFGFAFGASLLHDRLDSIDLITRANSFQRDSENVGLFIEQKWQWNALTIIPSGRFDKHSQFGWSKNPRVQGILEATDYLRFSASAARSFRAPTIDDLYYPFTDYGSGFSYVGNPSLRPEVSWTQDAGFELHGANASFKATYFHASVSNLIQSTLDDASTVINVGDARRKGAEIQIEHRWSQSFRHSLNYTYLDNRGIPPGFREKVELRYSPRHTVNWIGTISPCAKLDWDNVVRYVDKRYSGNNETGTKLGSMVLWDIKFTARLGRLEPYLSVRDVTNRRYEEQAGYPLPGRTYLGGASFKF